MYTLVVVFLIAGLLHPREIYCLMAGFIYFLCLPSAFVLLNIYSICNLNNVSWGTRELAKTPQPARAETKKVNGLGWAARVFGGGGGCSVDEEFGATLQSLVESVNRVERSVELISERELRPNKLSSLDLIKFNYENSAVGGERARCSWMDHECLSGAKTSQLDPKETQFFKGKQAFFFY